MQQPQSYLKCLVAGELVARCVKHVFRQYLLTVPQVEFFSFETNIRTFENL